MLVWQWDSDFKSFCFMLCIAALLKRLEALSMIKKVKNRKKTKEDHSSQFGSEIDLINKRKKRPQVIEIDDEDFEESWKCLNNWWDNDTIKYVSSLRKRYDKGVAYLFIELIRDIPRLDTVFFIDFDHQYSRLVFHFERFFKGEIKDSEDQLGYDMRFWSNYNDTSTINFLEDMYRKLFIRKGELILDSKYPCNNPRLIYFEKLDEKINEYKGALRLFGRLIWNVTNNLLRDVYYNVNIPKEYFNYVNHISSLHLETGLNFSDMALEVLSDLISLYQIENISEAESYLPEYDLDEYELEESKYEKVYDSDGYELTDTDFLMDEQDYIEPFNEVFFVEYEEKNVLDIFRKYANAVKFLLEKTRIPDSRDYKPEGLLNRILDSKNVHLITEAFNNPVFLNYIYEGKLPAYSWSASSGDEMIKALKSGDYKKSYDAEMNLIDRVFRDIGERYG